MENLPLHLGLIMVITLLENLPQLWLGTPSPGSLSQSLMVDSSSLLGGRGMDMLGSVLICSLPCSQLKAATLYVMGNLGLKTLVDVMEAVLQRELSMELDSLSELLGLLAELLDGNDSVRVVQGLAMLTSSCVLGVGDAGWVFEGNSSCTGTLRNGAGLLMTNKWCSSWSTVGEAMGAGWG